LYGTYFTDTFHYGNIFEHAGVSDNFDDADVTDTLNDAADIFHDSS
jgi:hypothetical protein